MSGPTFTEAMERLDGVLDDLEALRKRVDGHREVARAVAIAITNAETAALWLECASREWTSVPIVPRGAS